jgi:hypothetical protein
MKRIKRPILDSRERNNIPGYCWRRHSPLGLNLSEFIPKLSTNTVHVEGLNHSTNSNAMMLVLILGRGTFVWL